MPKPKIVWVTAYPEDRLRRCDVNPSLTVQQGYQPATLDYVRSHGQPCGYELRWWDGPTDREGKWHTRDVSLYDGLVAAKKAAREVAATVPWEVSVRLIGRVHGNAGYERAVVWDFGHYKLDTPEAADLRGDL